jgi:hypothetical protein
MGNSCAQVRCVPPPSPHPSPPPHPKTTFLPSRPWIRIRRSVYHQKSIQVRPTPGLPKSQAHRTVGAGAAYIPEGWQPCSKPNLQEISRGSGRHIGGLRLREGGRCGRAGRPRVYSALPSACIFFSRAKKMLFPCPIPCYIYFVHAYAFAPECTSAQIRVTDLLIFHELSLLMPQATSDVELNYPDKALCKSPSPPKSIVFIFR